VPADLTQVSLWISKTKDIYLNYLIEIYSDLRKIGYADELKHVLPQDLKKNKYKENILMILTARYKFNAFKELS
jgi:hypothetical protein